MTPFEAMTRLIVHADQTLTRNSTYRTETPELDESEKELSLSTAVIQAMLNTALPIARFRAFVEIDANSKRRGKITDEFTVCAVNIHGILGGLIGLHQARVDVRVTLWEQKAEGASMLTGFQGPTKSSRYRSWVEELVFQFDTPTEVATDGEA